MHGKPRHRWERHKLDSKSVLESKRIGLHENRRRVVTGISYQERSTTRLCVITLYVYDYTVVLAETEEDLQEKVNEVNRIGEMFDMKINAKKTKAAFTQRSLSGLTLYQSKVRSDKVCVNALNRIGKPDR